MIALYIVIILLSAVGISWRLEQGQSLSIKQCNAIKGISILLVFVTHANQYVYGNGYGYSMLGDQLFLAIDESIGQLCVVMFLFYSGFGTEFSILNKGENYAKRIPKRRCLTTLLNFDVAVIVFLVVSLLLGKTVTLSKFCLALTGWESIGNSNWYIFDIILCYFISFLSTRIATGARNRFLAILVLTLLLIAALYVLKPFWWYDTLLAYPAGAFVAWRKDWFIELARKRYWVVLSTSLLSFVLLINFGLAHVLTFNLASVMFAVLVVAITMRVRVENPVLVWLGANLFPIYIYQRVPMMVTTELFPSFVASQAVLFCVICFAVTLVIACAYKYIKISVG
jgi:hypothetical protein